LFGTIDFLRHSGRASYADQKSKAKSGNAARRQFQFH
jgi:hypothetical protein